MKWFYAVDRQRQGPVSDEEFARLVREGKIGPDTLVWCQGMDNWRRHGDLAPGQGGSAAAPQAAFPAAEAAADAAAPAQPADGQGPEAGSDFSDTAVCAVSFRRLPKSQMFQYGGDWVANDQRELFFRRPARGSASTQASGYASPPSSSTASCCG